MKHPDDNHIKKMAQQMELMKMALLDLIELGITPTTIRLGNHPSISVKSDIAVQQLKSAWTGQSIDNGSRYVEFGAFHCGVMVQWKKRIPHKTINWAAVKAAN